MKRLEFKQNKGHYQREPILNSYSNAYALPKSLSLKEKAPAAWQKTLMALYLPKPIRYSAPPQRPLAPLHLKHYDNHQAWVDSAHFFHLQELAFSNLLAVLKAEPQRLSTFTVFLKSELGRLKITPPPQKVMQKITQLPQFWQLADFLAKHPNPHAHRLIYNLFLDSAVH